MPSLLVPVRLDFFKSRLYSPSWNHAPGGDLFLLTVVPPRAVEQPASLAATLQAKGRWDIFEVVEGGATTALIEDNVIYSGAHHRSPRRALGGGSSLGLDEVEGSQEEDGRQLHDAEFSALGKMEAVEIYAGVKCDSEKCEVPFLWLYTVDSLVKNPE